MNTVLAFCALFATTSTPVGFTDDLDAAFQRAEKNNKCVYACFSGSDWCGWCKRLDKEVFAEKEFLDAVTNDFELVFIDSPSNKDLLSERAKVENPKLTKKYAIRGFPSALVFNPKGAKIAETGYRSGGAKAYAEHLKGMLALKDLDPAEKEKFLDKYEERLDGVMRKLNTKCRGLLKAEMDKGKSREEARTVADRAVAEFIPEVEAIVAEVESLQVPKELDKLHQEQLSAMKELVENMKSTGNKR